MFKCTIFSVLLLTLWGCNGVRVHFDFEDTYEDTDELLQDIKYHSFRVIFPGTKWCGAGNNAYNYTDLGLHRETDMCCREHDYCDDLLESGQTKHNLTNNSQYTKLHCKCDHKFYDCLKNTHKKPSNTVGYIYFDIYAPQCYRKDYPIVKCINHQGKRCIEYELDKSQPKVYDWFDVPAYIKKNKVQ